MPGAWPHAIVLWPVLILHYDRVAGMWVVTFGDRFAGTSEHTCVGVTCGLVELDGVLAACGAVIVLDINGVYEKMPCSWSNHGCTVCYLKGKCIGPMWIPKYKGLNLQFSSPSCFHIVAWIWWNSYAILSSKVCMCWNYVVIPTCFQCVARIDVDIQLWTSPCNSYV